MELISQLHLQDGYRMSSPAQCPQPLYSMMRDCWQFEVTDSLLGWLHNRLTFPAFCSTILVWAGKLPPQPLRPDSPWSLPWPHPPYHPHSSIKSREHQLFCLLPLQYPHHHHTSPPPPSFQPWLLVRHLPPGSGEPTISKPPYISSPHVLASFSSTLLPAQDAKTSLY